MTTKKINTLESIYEYYFKSKNNTLNKLLNETYQRSKDRINNPYWKITEGKLIEPKYIHDFERYIPDEFKHAWNDLDIETKTCLFIVAENAADNEEWD